MPISARLAALERCYRAGTSARAWREQDARDRAIALAIHGISDSGLRRATILEMRGHVPFTDEQRGQWADYLRDDTNLATFRKELQAHR